MGGTGSVSMRTRNSGWGWLYEHAHEIVGWGSSFFVARMLSFCFAWLVFVSAVSV